MPQLISPFLWFEGEAEAAAAFYVGLFPNSTVTSVRRYGEAGPLPAGTAMMVEFTLDGQEFMALNGSMTGAQPAAAPTPGSIALYVDCPTQSEVDRLWAALCEGGRALPCGWVTDRFGVTWNIVPSGLGAVIGGPDPERAERAMRAMLTMQKLDIEELRRVYAAD